MLQPSYQRLQETRSFFQFDTIDVDRYQLNGEETQVMLALRELNLSQLPAGRKSWVNALQRSKDATKVSCRRPGRV